MVRALHRQGRMGAVRKTLAHHAEGADLRPHRRIGGGAHDLAPRADRQRAQLGLPLLLAARRDADAARDDERRLLRGSGGVARLAGARHGRQPRAAADHVRPRRRAAPARDDAPLAAGLRKVAAGAYRQRGGEPAAARRLRRGDGRAAPGTQARPAEARGGVGPAGRAAQAPRDLLAGARRRPVGSARAAPALHLLEGDVLGGLRPRHQGDRDARPPRAGRAVALPARSHPRRRLQARLEREARQLRAALRLQGARREPAAHSHHRLPAGERSARARHDRSDPERADRGRLRAALSHAQVARRPAARRRRVPGLQLLARRLPDPARTARRGARAVRAPVPPGQRRRPALRRIRPALGPPPRQLPAGLLARRAGQHCDEPERRGEAGRAARRRKSRLITEPAQGGSHRTNVMTMLPADGASVTAAADPSSLSGLEKVLRGLSVFTMLMTVPQVLTVWIGRDAGGVSLVSWLSYLLAACLWFVYGVQKRDKTIYLACVGWVVLDMAIVVGVIVHR